MFLTPLEVSGGIGVVASGLALTAAMLSLRQKAANDRRDAWWKRAQWAIDHSLSPHSKTRLIGTEAMQLLALDATVSKPDLDVLDAALAHALDNR